MQVIGFSLWFSYYRTLTIWSIIKMQRTLQRKQICTQSVTTPTLYPLPHRHSFCDLTSSSLQTLYRRECVDSLVETAITALTSSSGGWWTSLRWISRKQSRGNLVILHYYRGLSERTIGYLRPMEMTQETWGYIVFIVIVVSRYKMQCSTKEQEYSEQRMTWYCSIGWVLN